MSTVIDELFAKASVLTEDERAALASRLFETLDPPEADEGVEEALALEVDRRLADLHAGRAKTIGWPELRARLHRRDR
jgi:putative addiction module component (TIGR02574 family)